MWEATSDSTENIIDNLVNVQPDVYVDEFWAGILYNEVSNPLHSQLMSTPLTKTNVK